MSPSSLAASAQGLPTSSVQWGAWSGAGMVGQAPALVAHLARLGLGLLRPQEGLLALSGVLRGLDASTGISTATLLFSVQLQLVWRYCVLRTQGGAEQQWRQAG